MAFYAFFVSRFQSAKCSPKMESDSSSTSKRSHDVVDDAPTGTTVFLFRYKCTRCNKRHIERVFYVRDNGVVGVLTSFEKRKDDWVEKVSDNA